jgi:hypothetical protein
MEGLLPYFLAGRVLDSARFCCQFFFNTTPLSGVSLPWKYRFTSVPSTIRLGAVKSMVSLGSSSLLNRLRKPSLPFALYRITSSHVKELKGFTSKLKRRGGRRVPPSLLASRGCSGEWQPAGHARAQGHPDWSSKRPRGAWPRRREEGIRALVEKG